MAFCRLAGPQGARRISARLSGFHPRGSVRHGPFRCASGDQAQHRVTGPATLLRQPCAKAACAAIARPLPAADRPSRLGSKQAAARLNSGATPTPRRAERSDRLGRDGWQRAGGNARRNGRARGPWPARTTPQNGPEEKSGGARSHAVPQRKTTPLHCTETNRCEREGQRRAHATEAIKGAAGSSAGPFTSASWEPAVLCR